VAVTGSVVPEEVSDVDFAHAVLRRPSAPNAAGARGANFITRASSVPATSSKLVSR